jgi:hypothetical protein
MAELLIKAISAAHADPVKDARGCYKQGDVAAIFDNGHEWGAEEGLPKFWIIKLPNITVAEAYQLEVMISMYDTPAPTPDSTVLRRRTAFFDVSLLNGGQRNTLFNTGMLTLLANFTQAQKFITYKTAP